MANDCYFSMQVRGKKENIEQFEKWLCAEYSYMDGKCEVNYDGAPIDHHIGYRIFEADEFYDKDSTPDADGTIYAGTYGYCAWSVFCCMFEGQNTYSTDNKIDIPQNKSITITEASRLLDLDIEIFSEEPGCAFSEHYIIRKGDIELNDCVDLVYHESEDGEWWYDSENHDEYGNFKWEM